MLLSKMRAKLEGSISHKNDLKKISALLIYEDLNLQSLSLYEIEGLWRMFSESRSASFLELSTKNLDDFLWDVKYGSILD